MPLRLPAEPAANDPIRGEWGRQLIRYIRGITPCSSEEVRPNITPNGTTYALRRKPLVKPGADVEAPFQIVSEGGLDIYVRGGTIRWEDKLISVADSDTITLDDETDDIKVWVELDDEFSSGTPTATFESDPDGWADYPDQANPTAVRYFLLALIDTADGAISETTTYWWGGDIPWKTVFGFYA